MALTPEDVVNKRFQSTKFREGYDQDEVDDFLDEVVVELRRLNQENAELRAAVAAGTVTQIQPVVEVVAPATPVPSIPVSSNDDETGSTNLLVLARRLHEQHVREGQARKEELIREGEAKAEQIIAEAKVEERAIKVSLEKERATLEERVESLRRFESDYRAKLRTYIEGQLAELSSGSVG